MANLWGSTTSGQAMQYGQNALATSLQTMFQKQQIDMEKQAAALEKQKINFMQMIQKAELERQQDALAMEREKLDMAKEALATEKAEKEEGKTSRGLAMFGGRRPVTPQGQVQPFFKPGVERAAAQTFIGTGDLNALNLLTPEKSQAAINVGGKGVWDPKRGFISAPWAGDTQNYSQILNRIKAENPDMKPHAQNALAYFESHGITPTAPVLEGIFSLGEESKGTLTGNQYANLVTGIYAQMVDVAIQKSKSDTSVLPWKKTKLVLPDIAQATELANHVVDQIGKNAGAISLPTLINMAMQAFPEMQASSQAQVKFNALPEEDKKTVRLYMENLGISMEEALLTLDEVKGQQKTTILKPNRPFPEE